MTPCNFGQWRACCIQTDELSVGGKFSPRHDTPLSADTIAADLIPDVSCTGTSIQLFCDLLDGETLRAEPGKLRFGQRLSAFRVRRFS